MSILRTIALVLIIVGALNWGLIGLMNFNLVTTLFGEGSTLTRIVYILVGLSGVAALTIFPVIMGRNDHHTTHLGTETDSTIR